MILASSPPSTNAVTASSTDAGLDVVELGGDHWTSPWGLFGSIEPSPAPGEWVSTGVSWVAWPLASWMARHTRCEVVGISMSLTPNWRTASSTALTMAGVEAIVPASPTPLTPSGFDVAGVVTVAVSKLGRSAAEGSV